MYNIVEETAGNIRALGRDALAGRWKQAVIVTLIYEICLTIPPMILNELFGNDLLGRLIGNSSVGDFATEQTLSYTPLSGIYVFLVTGAFTLGMSMFFLSLFRRQNEDVAQIFSGFEHFIKALGLTFMIGLFTALWTLLFIIPGIIAAFRYSQAFYILADDPSKSVMQCIQESKLMMRGNKGSFFFLNLSFIGWGILAALPYTIIGTAVGTHIDNIFIVELITFVAGIGILWVSAYMQASAVAFYEILTGHLRTKADELHSDYQM